MIGDFHDVRFPVHVAFGATGGPERRTEITALMSGHEKRNARQAHSRRRFDAASGIRSLDDLDAVVAFFEARRGELVAFRFRDPLDWKSGSARAEPTPQDQAIGSGDSATTQFQLVKRYGEGAEAYVRPIRLPVAESVSVAVDDTALPTSDFSVDPLSGVVTLLTPPATGAAVTVGFAFDLKARFATPSLTISVSTFKAGQIPSIPIVEVIG